MGLRVRLYGTERMRRERMIGESVVGFASVNQDTETTHWLTLEPRSNLSVSSSAPASEGGGDSCFLLNRLGWQKNRAELTFTVQIQPCVLDL